MTDYVVIGRDGNDTQAKARRATARTEHLALGDRMKSEGSLQNAAAILNEEGEMVGSIMWCRFDTRAQLEAWLEKEPYQIQGVWKQVEIHEVRIGPSFQTP